MRAILFCTASLFALTTSAFAETNCVGGRGFTKACAVEGGQFNVDGEIYKNCRQAKLTGMMNPTFICRSGSKTMTFWFDREFDENAGGWKYQLKSAKIGVHE